jgi:hypothetical protein
MMPRRIFRAEISRGQQHPQVDQWRTYLQPGGWLLHVRATIMLLRGRLSCVEDYRLLVVGRSLDPPLPVATH